MSRTAESEQGPSPAVFRDFFKEIHGYGPFPWQEKLVARVLDRGWPKLIDVPTGLGKTAVLDVAVFLSALNSEHARRRVFLVVDRRIIVDQAHAEAEKIRRALEDPPPGSVCERVRSRLAVPGDDAESVLDVTRMRGGADWSWLWLERPDRNAVITGTVDQIGSRLLFRGYGVGERLRPIDAALVGTDSLIIIDEAHLSDPFFSTLKDAFAMDGGSLGRPPIVVAMSASPEGGVVDACGITEEDVQHPVAGERLHAPKSLHPIAVSATAASATSAVADALAYWAKQLGGPGKVVGVVANTVSMARDVFQRLRSGVGDPERCVLLTGRIRPIDREYLLASWLPRVASHASRDLDAELYVVATQTIEAGADIDLDGMVTQTASLSALVQRLGRVNRMGKRDNARILVVHADKLADPVYGQVAERTWAWLTSLESPLVHKTGRSEDDFGAGVPASPARLRDLVSSLPLSDQALMQGEKPYVPVISRLTLDAWARSSPSPHPDVPVAPYLHGIDCGEPTVSVIWRADLQEGAPEGWARSVKLIPPSADEAVELPIGAVRRWLRQMPAAGAPTGKPQPGTNADVSDLESQEPGETETAEPGRAGLRVLRYRGTAEPELVAAREIRPGDFVIVPSSWGGCDQYGWHPGSTAPVTDVADFTGWRGRRSAAIRIGPVFVDAVRALAPALVDQAASFVARVKEDIANETVEEDSQYKDSLRQMIEAHESHLPHAQVLHKLARRGRLSASDRNDQGDEESTPATALFAAPGTSWNEDGSAGASSVAPERLTLSEHQTAVSRRAGEFASNLGLPERLARAVERAALHHDEGKRDFRFQVMLHGGDRLRAQAVADQPLAKSGMDPSDKAALRRAAESSGYPSGMRHEALSARIAASMLAHEPDADFDKDLVVHLVAAHHGCGRPLLPAIVDERPEKVRVQVRDGETAVFDTAETVDWAGPARFEKLGEQYGRWGVALLESIVRLADMWCSARSEGRDGDS